MVSRCFGCHASEATSLLGIGVSQCVRCRPFSPVVMSIPIEIPQIAQLAGSPCGSPLGSFEGDSGYRAPLASLADSDSRTIVHGIDLDRLDRELELLQHLQDEESTSPYDSGDENSAMSISKSNLTDMSEVRKALSTVQKAQAKLLQLGLLPDSAAEPLCDVTSSIHTDSFKEARHDVSLASDASGISERQKLHMVVDTIRQSIALLQMHEDTMHDVGSDDELSDGDHSIEYALTRSHSQAAPRGFMSYIGDDEAEALTGKSRSTASISRGRSTTSSGKPLSTYSWGTQSATGDECLSLAEDDQPEEAKPVGFLHLVGGDEPPAPQGFLQYISESEKGSEESSALELSNSDASELDVDEPEVEMFSMSDCPALDLSSCLSATKDEENAYRTWLSKVLRASKSEIKTLQVSPRMAVFLHFYRSGVALQDIIPRKIRTLNSWKNQGRHIIAENTHIHMPVVEVKVARRKVNGTLFDTSAAPASSTLWWFQRDIPNHVAVQRATRTKRVCYIIDTATSLSLKGRASKVDRKQFHYHLATTTNPCSILNSQFGTQDLKDMHLDWVLGVLEKNEVGTSLRNSVYALQSFLLSRTREEKQRLLLKLDEKPEYRQVLLKTADNIGVDLFQNIDASDIHLGETVALGSSCRVFVGSWKAESVAVIHYFALRTYSPESLAREMSLSNLLDHPNVLRLLGGQVNTGKEDMAVCDLKGRGSLNQMIRKKESILMELSMVLTILECVAAGLKYLHDRKIVVRDLNSGSILLGYEMSDICIGRLTNAHILLGPQDERHFEAQKYPAFVAPELAACNHYSFPVDIFSFGMITWMVVSMKAPFQDLKSHDIPQALIDGKRPPVQGCYPALRDLIESCWTQNPSDRPSIDKVIDALKGIRASISS